MRNKYTDKYDVFGGNGRVSSHYLLKRAVKAAVRYSRRHNADTVVVSRCGGLSGGGHGRMHAEVFSNGTVTEY